MIYGNFDFFIMVTTCSFLYSFSYYDMQMLTSIGLSSRPDVLIQQRLQLNRQRQHFNEQVRKQLYTDKDDKVSRCNF